MYREQTCCFTEHRILPKDKIQNIVKNLDREIDNLIGLGVTTFISGGAIGFDMITASLIIDKKERGRDIKLVFALPYKKQDERWDKEQKNLYRSLLAEADEIVYLSEEYDDSCMMKRNYYMVDRSAYCICALLYILNEL